VKISSRLDKLDDLGFLNEKGEEMFRLLAQSPKDYERAWILGEETPLPNFNPNSINQILVVGMGGSAIGGNFMQAIANMGGSCPVIVTKGYTLPAWVKRDTLVFFISYSGNTEETLYAYHQVKEKGAQCLIITSGGILATEAEEGDMVLFVPPGLPPRMALPWLSLPLLVLASRLNLINLSKDQGQSIAGAVAKTQKLLAPEVKTEKNQAKQIASLLWIKTALIWGVQNSTEAVAMRWKCQLNENSKIPAFYNCLPEASHNEIMAVETLPWVSKDYQIICLRDQEDHPRLDQAFQVTQKLLEDKTAGFINIWGEGETLLARNYSLVLLGDYISTYLACLYGIDPLPIDLISQFKEGMKNNI